MSVWECDDDRRLGQYVRCTVLSLAGHKYESRDSIPRFLSTSVIDNLIGVVNFWERKLILGTLQEIERHETLVHRARKRGGFLNGPNGTRIRIQKQEFPYDIGIYANIRQGMGSNPLLWLWPFTSTPSNDSGHDFETNGFEGKRFMSLVVLLTWTA